MQECFYPPWGIGYSLICLRSPDPTREWKLFNLEKITFRGDLESQNLALVG
jgi:hypothetical protein